MKKGKQIITFLILAGMVMAFKPVKTVNSKPKLKDAFSGKFYIGTAMNTDQITGKDTAAIQVIKENFNAIVAENCMKSGPLQPEEGVFDFSLADKFIAFGEQNNMHITGHALVWHAQAPQWFFKDSLGNDVTREVLISRMRNHIHAVVGRYKGSVKGWDVVNEAIDRDGSYRKSRFYQIIGEDFIRLAFEFAYEADPQCELYYNDYSLTDSVKRRGAVAMVKKLKEQGVKIDAVGEQGHIGLNTPTLLEIEQTIKDFAALGVKVMFTEIDVSVLPMDWSLGADISARMEYKKQSDLYTNGLPDSVYHVFENRYLDLFKLFLKHEDVVTRVTLWGVTDAQSWKNWFPIPGRTDYPLLFDRNYKAKPVVEKIVDEALKK
jgi:endo-1,4-beta-xylanase